MVAPKQVWVVKYTPRTTNVGLGVSLIALLSLHNHPEFLDPLLLGVTVTAVVADFFSYLQHCKTLKALGDAELTSSMGDKKDE